MWNTASGGTYKQQTPRRGINALLVFTLESDWRKATQDTDDEHRVFIFIISSSPNNFHFQLGLFCSSGWISCTREFNHKEVNLVLTGAAKCMLKQSYVHVKHSCGEIQPTGCKLITNWQSESTRNGSCLAHFSALVKWSQIFTESKP